jgi:hypothetical protein
MAELVIICRGVTAVMARQGRETPEGQYLANFDPEANDGRGMAWWSLDPGKAMRFPDAAAAHACWTVVPVTRPLREGGQPNRPLTAFTVEYAPFPAGLVKGPSDG